MLPIGEILVKEGYCTKDDIRAALDAQAQGDKRLIGEILLTMKKITIEQLERALAIQWSSSTKVGF